jgi:hydroxymethylbilane synthase
MPEIRVGTRVSLLALTQTRGVVQELTRINPALKFLEVGIISEGDKNTDPLHLAPTPGIFVQALRSELLAGAVDVIVHSMKDLPAAPHPEITLAAVPIREDIRDVVLSRGGERLIDLAPGALVGTSSPRREASVRRLRPDLRVESIRGNITTRIAKVHSGEYDATILALAGLSRCGLSDSATEILPLEDFLPAPRQGALAIECRIDDTELIALLSQLDNSLVRLCTSAEQGVLLGLNAGCATAVSAVATWADDQLEITAELAVAETGEYDRVSGIFPLGLLDTDQALNAGRVIAEKLLGSPVRERATLP